MILCLQILVLELGSVKEYDTPKNLMTDVNSEFYGMVQETGPQNAAFLRAVALGTDEVASSVNLDLVRAAKESLANTSVGAQLMEGGPLMKSVYAAANTFQSGWENRRAENWSSELRDQAVSMKQWIEKMSELLEKVGSWLIVLIFLSAIVVFVAFPHVNFSCSLAITPAILSTD